MLSLTRVTEGQTKQGDQPQPDLRDLPLEGNTMRWLWSPKAIQCHIAFWAVGGIFISLLFGSKEELQKYLPGNDWIWLLLFLVVGYPFVLVLLWLENRGQVQHMEREANEIRTNPEKVRWRRDRWRRGEVDPDFWTTGRCFLDGRRVGIRESFGRPARGSGCPGPGGGDCGCSSESRPSVLHDNRLRWSSS
jgi:hypothetical protein